MKSIRRAAVLVMTAAILLIAATNAVSQVAGNATLCLNPVTCVAPHDAVGTTEPLGSDRGIASDSAHRVVKPDCDYRDRLMAIRSSYLGNTGTRIANATPAQAIARYFTRRTLPAGLVSADWAELDGTLLYDSVTYVTRRANAPSVILGVISLQRYYASWRVNWMMACGEYLYPGSLIVG